MTKLAILCMVVGIVFFNWFFWALGNGILLVRILKTLKET